VPGVARRTRVVTREKRVPLRVGRQALPVMVLLRVPSYCLPAVAAEMMQGTTDSLLVYQA